MTSMILTDGDGDTLCIDLWDSGRVSLLAWEGGTHAVVGPFDPDDVIAAIRKAARETDEPAPTPSKSPTAEDFAKEEFARHPDGRIAARVDPRARRSWRASDDYWLSDADMAAGGWQIVTPAPTTPREALALAVSLAYEPEGDTMPDQPGYVMVREGGRVSAFSDSNSWGLPARGATYRLLLLDPPAPVTPEGAETIQDALVSICPTDDLDGIEATTDHIAARVRVVPGEVEA